MNGNTEMYFIFLSWIFKVSIVESCTVQALWPNLKVSAYFHSSLLVVKLKGYLVSCLFRKNGNRETSCLWKCFRTSRKCLNLDLRRWKFTPRRELKIFFCLLEHVFSYSLIWTLSIYYFKSNTKITIELDIPGFIVTRCSNHIENIVV